MSGDRPLEADKLKLLDVVYQALDLQQCRGFAACTIDGLYWHLDQCTQHRGELSRALRLPLGTGSICSPNGTPLTSRILSMCPDNLPKCPTNTGQHRKDIKWCVIGFECESCANPATDRRQLIYTPCGTLVVCTSPG